MICQMVEANEIDASTDLRTVLPVNFNEHAVEKEGGK